MLVFRRPVPVHAFVRAYSAPITLGNLSPALNSQHNVRVVCSLRVHGANNISIAKTFGQGTRQRTWRYFDARSQRPKGTFRQWETKGGLRGRPDSNNPTIPETRFLQPVHPSRVSLCQLLKYLYRTGKTWAPVNLDRIQHWVDTGRLTCSREKPITARELLLSGCIHDVHDGIKILGDVRLLLSIRCYIHRSFVGCGASQVGYSHRGVSRFQDSD